MDLQSLHNLSPAGVQKQLAQRLSCAAVLIEGENNLLEVVGTLEGYGVVLGEYARNLIYAAEKHFLSVFAIFKYLNGEFYLKKLLAHLAQKRLNYEYAEYCAGTIYWHGAPKVTAYLQTPEFIERVETAIRARLHSHPLARIGYNFAPAFVIELVRRSCYHSILGQFWQVMSRIFLDLAEDYKIGKIQDLAAVVKHISEGLTAAAEIPLTYSAKFSGQEYALIPASADLRWLMDAAVPYVEIIFFRALPPKGVFSYDASAQQIPNKRSDFRFGVLYADASRVGASGVTPTLLMRDIHNHIEAPLRSHFPAGMRNHDEIYVRLCKSFQKAMFCVTNAAVLALAPLGDETDEARSRYFDQWATRLKETRIIEYETCNCNCSHNQPIHQT